MIDAHMDQMDQTLPTGSIVHWRSRDPENSNRVAVTCGRCGNVRYATPQRGKRWKGFCLKCANKGSAHHNWKGGRTIDKDGYIQIHQASLSTEDLSIALSMLDHLGYVREHRLVMARKLGRPLEQDELVHHLNGKTDDNRLVNLDLISRKEHPKEHATINRQLQDEIGRLQTLLDEHGIDYSKETSHELQ